MTESKKIPYYIRFVTGGAAGKTATCFLFPIDLVKNRMQMSGVGSRAKVYKNSLEVLMNVIHNEGVRKCWNGLSAGLLRQGTYTATRLGAFQVLVDLYKDYVHPVPSLEASMCMGLIAGAAGAVVGNPAEVALIRMTTDGILPVAERRNYKNVTDALKRIPREEGLFGLWKGCSPTICRGMVVNMCQLASYSQVKNYFHKGPLKVQDLFGLHAAASTFTGFLISIFSMPLDIAKTRLQNMKIVPYAKPTYSGTIDVLSKIVTKEGPLALWKGFTPYFVRITQQTILTFLFLEQYNYWYLKYVIGVESS